MAVVTSVLFFSLKDQTSGLGSGLHISRWTAAQSSAPSQHSFYTVSAKKFTLLIFVIFLSDFVRFC